MRLGWLKCLASFQPQNPCARHTYSLTQSISRAHPLGCACERHSEQCLRRSSGHAPLVTRWALQTCAGGAQRCKDLLTPAPAEKDATFRAATVMEVHNTEVTVAPVCSHVPLQYEEAAAPVGRSPEARIRWGSTSQGQEGPRHARENA